MSFGLSDTVIAEITAILNRYPAVQKALLYGSRAKGNYKNGSDIDLTLIGKALTHKDLLRISSELDDSMIPHTVDLSLFECIDNAKLREHIERVGVVFYERRAVGWTEMKISDLYKVASSKRVLKSDWKSEGVPFYRGREITTLSKFGYVENDLYITEEIYNDYSLNYGVPVANDIMVTAIGTIGNTYIVRNQEKFYFKDASVLWLKKEKEVDSNFVSYWFKSSHFTSQLDVGLGATVDTLTIGKVQSLKINVPSISIQQKIVKKLDAIFTEIDKAMAAAEANAKNAKELISSFVSQSFNALKSDLKYIKLGDVCSSVAYGSSAKSESFGKVPVLRMGNIFNGKLDYSDLVFTNNEDEIKKYQLINGDVLFNRTNSPLHVGKSAAFYSATKTIFAGYLIRINYDRKKVIPEYLTYYLNSKEVREYGYSVMSHSINQANINGSKLKGYPFLCPSIEVQKTIVDAINSIKIHSDFLVEHYANKIKNLNLYKQSILKLAFNGELVKE